MNEITFSQIEDAARHCLADHALVLFDTQQQRSLKVDEWGRLVGTHLGVADVRGRPWRQQFRAWVRHTGLDTVDGKGHELYAASISTKEGFAEHVDNLSKCSAEVAKKLSTTADWDEPDQEAKPSGSKPEDGEEVGQLEEESSPASAEDTKTPKMGLGQQKEEEAEPSADDIVKSMVHGFKSLSPGGRERLAAAGFKEPSSGEDDSEDAPKSPTWADDGNPHMHRDGSMTPKTHGRWIKEKAWFEDDDDVLHNYRLLPGSTNEGNISNDEAGKGAAGTQEEDKVVLLSVGLKTQFEEMGLDAKHLYDSYGRGWTAVHLFAPISQEFTDMNPGGFFPTFRKRLSGRSPPYKPPPISPDKISSPDSDASNGTRKRYQDHKDHKFEDDLEEQGVQNVRGKLTSRFSS